MWKIELPTVWQWWTHFFGDCLNIFFYPTIPQCFQHFHLLLKCCHFHLEWTVSLYYNHFEFCKMTDWILAGLFVINLFQLFMNNIRTFCILMFNFSRFLCKWYIIVPHTILIWCKHFRQTPQKILIQLLWLYLILILIRMLFITI